MAKKKTNVTINGYGYHKIKRKTGQRQNAAGEWVPVYKIFYGKTEKEALDKYDEYMKRDRVTRDLCFGALMDTYISRVFLPDDSLRDTTKSRYINAYRNVFKDSPVLGADVATVSGLDLQGIASGSTFAASSVRAAFKLVKRFYQYLEAQHIARDITPGITLPPVRTKRDGQRVETFSGEELRRFCEKIPEGHRLRLLVVLGMETGARIAELAALTYEDIQGENMIINKALSEIDPIEPGAGVRVEITPTKTKSSIRAVPLSGRALDALAVHKEWHTREMQENGYQTGNIFTTSTGSLYYKSTLRTAFKRLCASCGVTPRGFHVFRHTFGTRLAASGVPIQTVSRLMGHSDISVTAAYYIDIPEKEKRDAIARLDDL